MVSIAKLAGIAFALVLCACSSDLETDQVHHSENRRLRRQALILIDKSESLSDSLAQEQLLQPLMSHVSAFVNDHGDQVQIGFVHGNTLGGKPVFKASFDWKIHTDEELSEMGGTSRDEALKAMEDKAFLQQQKLKSKIRESFRLPSGTTTMQHTDLWGSFELASRFFEPMGKEELGKRLYFVSDMEESMKGQGRRNFTFSPPENKGQAQQWAKEDANWIRENLIVKAECLAAIEVHVYLPNRLQSSTNYQEIRYYWEALFQEFGMELVQTH